MVLPKLTFVLHSFLHATTKVMICGTYIMALVCDSVAALLAEAGVTLFFLEMHNMFKIAGNIAK